jgi:hypothetical protein
VCSETKDVYMDHISHCSRSPRDIYILIR